MEVICCDSSSFLYQLDGAETHGVVATATLNYPVTTMFIRLLFTMGNNGYDISGRFEVIGYPYSAVNGRYCSKMFSKWFSLLIFTFDVKIEKGMLKSLWSNCHTALTTC